MASKRERFLQELAAEDDTPAVTEPTPDPAPAPDPEPSPEPDPEPAPEPEPEPSPDPQPDPEPSPEPEKKERTIPDDKFERAEFSFRRQLSKTKDKYERELKDRDEKYAKLEAELAELKKATTPKKELRRDEFDNDEDFIRALQAEEVRKALAERDEENARKAAEQAEADKRRREEEEAIRAEQEAWLGNIDRAFSGDAQRKDAFIRKVQYANGKGFGALLDSCPVAADYLMKNPAGPVVFEKILNDRATFERVFDENRTSPLDIYYELRQVENELRNAGSPAPAPAPVKAAMPHLGKPGRQAGSGHAPDIWNDDKAFKAYMKSKRR